MCYKVTHNQPTVTLSSDITEETFVEMAQSADGYGEESDLSCEEERVHVLTRSTCGIWSLRSVCGVSHTIQM